MTDPGLFQPWRQDSRPVWRVSARWATEGRHGDDDLVRLAKTLDQTGMTRAPRFTPDCGWLTATVLVKASGSEAAELIAVRVVEVAHQVAGLGALGINVARHADRHPTPGRTDP